MMTNSLRDFHTSPYQNSGTQLLERRFAVFQVQFSSVQLRGIGANFALTRTRLEHVGLVPRAVGGSSSLLNRRGTCASELSVSLWLVLPVW